LLTGACAIEDHWLAVGEFVRVLRGLAGKTSTAVGGIGGIWDEAVSAGAVGTGWKAVKLTVHDDGGRGDNGGEGMHVESGDGASKVCEWWLMWW
jgi:hypothetical protein